MECSNVDSCENDRLKLKILQLELNNAIKEHEIVTSESQKISDNMDEIIEPFMELFYVALRNVCDEEEYFVPSFEEFSKIIVPLQRKSNELEKQKELLKNKQSDMQELIDQTEKLIVQTEKMKYPKVDELEEQLKNYLPTVDICLVCKSMIRIPVKIHWWSCTKPDKNGLIRCRVPLCVDCTNMLFHLDESSNTRPIVPCPICHSKVMRHPKNIHEIYTIDNIMMNILDHFIINHSNGKSLVECIKCSKWFPTLSDYWKHIQEIH